ncbi:hypothetical protein TNCV_4332951 [Trichonephila clavipes]|nr:hypothetical protein TNCV_4332951 [Trichonephila clavipes]
MDDNARPHRTLDVEELLESEDITRMDWPAYSPDLNPIEHVWDALGRRIAARLHHPENTQQLKQMLIEEWVLLPQEMLHQLVLSMRRRCEATIAPPLTELNLALPFYIGGVPNTRYVHQDSGVTKGLDGAIQKVILNGEPWTHFTAKAVRAHGIRNFKGPPCAPGACLNGGTCIPRLNSQICQCLTKYMGKRCEKRIRKKDFLRAISFNGTTVFNFPYINMKGSKRRKSNRFQVRFRTTGSSGLLFWTNKRSALKSDYLAAAIVDGYPELSFILRKQRNIWSVRSDQRVDDGLWHTVSFLRKDLIDELKIFGMSSRHHIDDFMRGRIIGKIEEGRKITDVAREFGIAHSVVSWLWKSFKTTGMCNRRHGGGRVRSTTPAEDRYIVLSAKRNRRTTAQQVANQFLSASGKQISRKTVARRLRGGGLYARRPVVCVPLTRQHRSARLQWWREHHNWTEQDWACVLFSDESRFSLSSDCRRQLIWRESGTAYRPENIQEKDRYPTCSIMVWAGIMINGRTRLHVVANGTMTGQRYIDEVLLPHDCLDSEGIQRLVWPARSPDLNPIENVWDALGRQVAGRNYPPTNKNTLFRALTEEWDKLPQQLLDNVVQSMVRRVECCITLQGGHIPKKRLGEIRVDKTHVVSNISESGATDLNTDGILWIGGSPALPHGLPPAYYEGFTGCMESITVDKSPIHQIISGKRDIEYCSNSKIRQLDEAHFWLNGYVNKQNCRIWSEANPQVYVETPLHPEKLTVWCALWAGGILLQKR